jgi:putative transposase
LHEDGLLTLSEEAWAKAKRRAAIIIPLANQDTVTRSEAQAAAKTLGISSRLVYVLISRCRHGQGLLTDLAPRISCGGKGKARIQGAVEKIVNDVLESFYLTRQRRSVALIVREIRRRCIELKYPVPARNTIEARIRGLDPKTVASKRDGYDATKRLTPLVGETPLPSGPLGVVQMDHSHVDVIIVEQSSRQPIGRPWLTLAIDVYTRCIVGMLLTLEAPSATSVGLCLAHAVCSKDAYLLRLGLEDV